MANFYDDTPELARAHELPEVYNPSSPSHRHITHQTHQTHQVNESQQQEWSPLQSNPSAPLPLPPLPPKPVSYTKHDESVYNRQTMDSAAASTLHHYAAEPRGTGPAYPAGSRGVGGGGTLASGSRLVLILSILCGILGLAVVGLAAGTGVVASKYADTSLRLEHLSSSYSSLESHSKTATSPPSMTAAAAPAATDFSELTNGCSETNEKTTGSTFTSKFFERPTFTMFCNTDTPTPPLMALFAGNFDMCMEACGSWNDHIAQNNITAKDCKGVSFVPNWFNVTQAAISKAAGDCYLKPGPLNRTALKPPKGTVEVHSALLESLKNEDDGGDNKSDSPKKRDIPMPVRLF